MPQAPTWEETVAVPSWEDTVDESQAPEPPKETEQEFVQRMGKPIVPTKAQLNEPRSPKELFEPFKKLPRVDSNDPRFRAAVVGILGRPASEDTLSSVAAALNSAAGFTEGFESPAGVATAFAGPLGKVAQKLAALGWGAYSAAQVPEAARTAGELSVTGTPQEKKEAYLGLAGSIAIPAAIGAGVVGESPARGLAREISKAVPKFEDTFPIPVREQGVPAAPPQGMVGLKDLTPQSEAAATAAPPEMVGEPTTKLSPQAEAAVQEVIQKTAPILPRAAKEAAVSVEEQARLQKEIAEELGQEPTKKEGEAHSSDLAKAQEAAPTPAMPPPATEAAPPAVPPALPKLVSDVLSRPDRDANWVWMHATKEEKAAVDKWVVDTKHPLATQPGTAEGRFKALVQENIPKPPPPTPAPVKAEPSGGLPVFETRGPGEFASKFERANVTPLIDQYESKFSRAIADFTKNNPRGPEEGLIDYRNRIRASVALTPEDRPLLQQIVDGLKTNITAIKADLATEASPRTRKLLQTDLNGVKGLLEKYQKELERAPSPPPPQPQVKAEPSAPPPPSEFAKRQILEEDAIDYIKDLNASKNPAQTRDEAWERFRSWSGNKTRGTPIVDEDYFKSAWDSFQKPTPPPPAQPKGETGVKEAQPVKIPTVNIYGATGDRAAVLVKFKNARPVKTDRMGEKYPIYEIRSGKTVLGEGHGTTDAWKQTAQNLYRKPEPPAQPKGKTGRISGEFEVGGKKFEVVAKQTENPELVRIVGVHRTDVARPEGGKERTDLMGAIGTSGIKKAIDSILKQFPNAKEVEFYRASKEGQRRYVRMPIKREPPLTPPPVEQKGVEPGSPLPPGFQGPGAARVGDVPAAPPQAIAAGAKVEQAPPESRPMGFASTLGVAINNARQAIRGLGTTLKGFAGATMPKTTARDRLLGEAGARYLSSRIAARPLAASFSARVLQDTNVDPFKFGAALTEDNLRSVRESLRQKATELTAEGKTAEADLMTQKADDVKTIIGSKGSPFADEEAYFDFLDQPNTKKAIAQHLQLWQEVIDPQYKEAQGIDPDVELPSRGQQTGARINLKAVLPDQPATKPVMGSSSGLTATFKRKSPFGIKARGTGQAYDVDYHSIIRNTFERQLEIANKNAFDRMLEQTGNAVVDKPGRTIDIGGEPAVAFPLSRKIIIATGEEGPKSFSQAKNIYVRKELADEYRAASNVDRRYRWPVITPIMNGLNRAALAGLTDATVHVSNQMTALFNRPTSGKFWTDTLLSTTGRADVPVTLVRTILKAFKDNQLQEAELAKIGAMRQQGDIHYGVFGRVLQHTDKLTRLVLDDTFKGLVKEGLVENTETARREYVNQIGQYNRRAQGLITRAARDIGFGPFVTAGKTFNALGVRMATLSPGAPAANGFAAAALRANVLSKWIGGAVVVGTMNYLITGKMMGRPGTPLGNIDTGKNDKSGKQLSLPFLSLLGLGRGLRVTGAKGAIDAKRMGLTDSDAIDAATRDIINSWTSPFAGPPVKFGLIAATGYQPAVNVGRASRVVPPGESQFNQNVGDAIRQSSPVIQTYIKAREGKSVPEILSTQVPRFTMQPGKSESMVANYPKIVSMAQGAAFIDDMIHEARRMDPDKRRQFVIEQVRRLPPSQWDHAFREVARRRVYK